MKPPFAFDQTVTGVGRFAHRTAGSRREINVAVSTKGTLLTLQEHISIKP